MRYRFLGQTGLRVSELCMGTMTFGSDFYGIAEVSPEDSYNLVACALEGGINFFDSADIYSRGHSESILGDALKKLNVDRDSIVLATKVYGPMSDAAAAGTGDMNNTGLSRKHIIASCEASLRRLKTDHIDLYQIHGWDDLTPVDETMRALDDLVRQGKVRYIGCSNLSAWQVVKANSVAKSHNGAEFISLQAYYTLVGRELELELLPMCRHEGLGVMVWSPLAGGFITGKFRRGRDAPEGARRASLEVPPFDWDKGYDLIEALDGIAAERGVSIPQLALSWLLEQPGVSTVIIGAKNVRQLEDNLAAIRVSWTDGDRSLIDAMTEPPRIYPTWMHDLTRRR